MPGMDGWTVLSELKADEHLADIPVVVVTMIEDKNRGFTLGATEYLLKPINRKRLVSVLNRYLPNEPELADVRNGIVEVSAAVSAEKEQKQMFRGCVQERWRAVKRKGLR